MVFEICLVEYVVNESGGILHACGIGLGIGTVERQIEAEIREVLFDLVVIVEIEGLFERTGTVKRTIPDAWSFRCGTGA